MRPNEAKSKRQVLMDKVIAMTKEFIEIEGGISLEDLEALFGSKGQSLIATHLRKIMKVTA